MQKSIQMRNTEKHGSYRELLFDKRWLEKRSRIIQRDKYKCIICGATDNLTVHHKQYHISADGKKLLPWQYDDKYLITICKSCHQKGHSKYDIPIKKIKKHGNI